MKIKINKILYDLIDILLFLYIFTEGINTTSITNLTTNVIAVVMMGLLLLYMWRKRKVVLHNITIYFGLFTLVSFCSILWASHSDWALTRSITLLRLLILTGLLYNYLLKESKQDRFIFIICLAGILYSAYAIVYFGISNFGVFLLSGRRMDDIFDNANQMGMQAAIAAIICLWYVLYKGKKRYLFGVMPCLLIAFGSGSRTALVGLFFGVVLVAAFRQAQNTRLTYFFEALAVIIFLVYAIQLPAFSNMFRRLGGLLEELRGGKSSTDGSVSDRFLMIRYGLEQIASTPFLGIGIGCSGDVAGRVSSVYSHSFLHNNYIDLLVCVGIVGTVFYYSLYYIPAKTILRRFGNRNDEDCLVLVLLLTLLVMQLGSVDYYSKDTYLCMTLFHLVVDAQKVRKPFLARRNKSVLS